MATYSSKEIPFGRSAAEAYKLLSNLENLSDLLAKAPMDQIPADKRDVFDKVRITSDTISFPAGPVGELTLRKADCIEPSLINLVAENSPVPLSMKLHIRPAGAESSELKVEIDVQIPAMLKPMIGGTLQKMVDDTAGMFGKLV